ncbi:hypothetical protein PV08_06017 [Exophiala spinifera]|uniref:Uncharacterized protein n=1 Tax=Exophiala spinifera TaxID=91928 RepID=A0A0D1ZT63_9EURO|nr:uncharacterized protein PV08_06017 [Exophiala spinifera]KIW15967.1 hypothetical protein PV08_06017 [Exophiala spinifera]
MNKGLTAATCVSYQRPAFIWISDGLLADTFARFCHQKRHGSNVPGPLEAQRRTSRRKNASLAYVAHSAPQVDPALIFTRSQNIDWWHTPTKCEKPGAPVPHLQAWLLQTTGSTEGLSEPLNDGPPIPRLRRDDQDELSQCRSLAEVHEWLARQDTMLLENVELGQSIWRHILQTPFSGEEIAEYISDPSFHPTGTSYIVQLLPTLLSHTWSVGDWRLVRDSTARAAELGLVNLEDLRTILDTLCTSGTIALRSTEGDLVETRREKLYLIYDILRSLRGSKILQLSELGSSFLSELFSKLGKLDTSGLRRALTPILWDLVPWGRASDAAVFSQIVVRYLRDAGRNAHKQASDSSAAILLKEAPLPFLRMLFLHTTENLIKLARDKPTNAYKHLFRRWIDLLADLGFSGENAQPTRNEWAIYQRHNIDFTRDQRKLIFAWTALHLTQHSRNSPHLQVQLRGHHLFGRTMNSVFFDQGFSKVQFYGEAQSTLKSLALPNKSVLLDELELLTSVLGAPESSNSSECQVGESLPYDLALVLEDRVYKHKRRRLHFNGALEELGECLNHDLAGFCSMSRRLIHKNDASFDIITRLLECNGPLKAALSRSFRQDQAGERGSRNSNAFLPVPESGCTQTMLVPSQALALVNHLAISFATAPVARPRRALRRVYWCYRFLHRYGAPIQADVTKALWHAGVARIGEFGYGDFGTAKSLLKWIIWQVRLVEGDDVAAQLLWSRSYRSERRAEVTALAEPTGQAQANSGMTSDVRRALNEVDRPHLSASRFDAGCIRGLPSANAEHSPVHQQPRQESGTRADTCTGLEGKVQLQLTGGGDALEKISGVELASHANVMEVDASTTAITTNPVTERRMRDLMVLRKIRHVKMTDMVAKPFWYTKQERRMDWERRATAAQMQKVI